MERLTCRDADGNVHHQWEFNGVNGSYDILDEELLGKQIDRLAAYEDSGLEPQDVISAVDMAKIACALHELNAYKDLGPIDHIRDLLQAEQDGRLVVLPCKVGDHVWADGREAIIVWFFGYKTERYLHAQFFDNAKHTDIPFYEIGKTVFLAREEAEEALKGGEA